jgi:adenosylmethionine-8-amino-7-oxononanoate aminotransferase
MGGIDLKARQDAPGARGLQAHKKLFHDERLVVRNSMDTLQFAPFLNAQPEHLHAAFAAVRRTLDLLN